MSKKTFQDHLPHGVQSGGRLNLLTKTTPHHGPRDWNSLRLAPRERNCSSQEVKKASSLIRERRKDEAEPGTNSLPRALSAGEGRPESSLH